MEDRHKTTAPAIRICIAGNAGPKEGFLEMLNGIEEEGIPFELVESSLNDITDLSYEAAIGSSLSVGLGINADEVALHFDKLPRSAPLYIIRREVDRQYMRSMGINAARLVKRMPFNDINQRRRREPHVQ